MDDKYSVRNIENLPQPIQMELSKKQNFFPQFVAALLKSPSNLKHFEKKDEPHRLCISRISYCKKDG